MNGRAKFFAEWEIFFLAILLLDFTGCLHAGKNQDDRPVVEYDGTGQYSGKQQNSVINGTVLFKNHNGEEILLEARHSVPCESGRCPVIGESPVATLSLSQPGPFSMSLTQSPKDLMLIAICRSSNGSTRIAHVWLNQDEPVVSEVKLSLDRPYPPLR